MPLLIAPQGGRSHVTAMRRAKPGIAYIIEQTGLPALPTGLVGTTEDFFQRAFRHPKPILEMQTSENRSCCLRSKQKEYSGTKWRSTAPTS
ncbi:MAG: hypothetical protein U0X93_05825 [Anaerolineales bacterium]